MVAARMVTKPMERRQPKRQSRHEAGARLRPQHIVVAAESRDHVRRWPMRVRIMLPLLLAGRGNRAWRAGGPHGARTDARKLRKNRRTSGRLEWPGEWRFTRDRSPSERPFSPTLSLGPHGPSFGPIVGSARTSAFSPDGSQEPLAPDPHLPHRTRGHGILWPSQRARGQCVSAPHDCLVPGIPTATIARHPAWAISVLASLRRAPSYSRSAMPIRRKPGDVPRRRLPVAPRPEISRRFPC